MLKKNFSTPCCKPFLLPLSLRLSKFACASRYAQCKFLCRFMAGISPNFFPPPDSSVRCLRRRLLYPVKSTKKISQKIFFSKPIRRLEPIERPAEEARDKVTSQATLVSSLNRMLSGWKLLKRSMFLGISSKSFNKQT